LSPFTQPGSTTSTGYNHYSLLRTIEDAFAINHLDFAAASGLQPFGSDVLNAAPTAASTSTTTAVGRGVGATLPATGRSTPLVLPAAMASLALMLWVVTRRRRKILG